MVQVLITQARAQELDVYNPLDSGWVWWPACNYSSVRPWQKAPEQGGLQDCHIDKLWLWLSKGD